MPPDFCFPRVCPAVIHLCSSASRPQVANRSQAFRKHSSIELSSAFQKNLKSHTLHIINCYSFAGASRLKRAPKPDSRRRFSPSFSPRFPSGSANYTRFLSRFSSGFSPRFPPSRSPAPSFRRVHFQISSQTNLLSISIRRSFWSSLVTLGLIADRKSRISTWGSLANPSLHCSSMDDQHDRLVWSASMISQYDRPVWSTITVEPANEDVRGMFWRCSMCSEGIQCECRQSAHRPVPIEQYVHWAPVHTLSRGSQIKFDLFIHCRKYF